MAIPWGMSYLQLYIPVNKPFNDHLKQLFWMVLGWGPCSDTETIKKPMAMISPEVTIRGFKLCYISEETGGWGTIANVGNKHKNVSTECEKDDGNGQYTETRDW